MPNDFFDAWVTFVQGDEVLCSGDSIAVLEELQHPPLILRVRDGHGGGDINLTAKCRRENTLSVTLRKKRCGLQRIQDLFIMSENCSAIDYIMGPP